MDRLVNFIQVGPVAALIVIYFCENDLGIEQDREMFAPLSTKLMERIWERSDELLIDESYVKLWIVTNDRLARIDQCLDYTGEPNLTLVDFIDSLMIFLGEACLYLASSLQKCRMALLNLGLLLFFLFRLCAGLAEDRVNGSLLSLVFLNIEEAKSCNKFLVPFRTLLGETAQEVFLLEPFSLLNVALVRLPVPIEKHTRVHVLFLYLLVEALAYTHTFNSEDELFV